MTRTLFRAVSGATLLPAAAFAQVLAPAPLEGDRISVEAVGGSRDAGAFGRHGEELRAAWQRAGEAWSVGLGSGVVRDEGDGSVHASGSVEARYAFADSGFFTGTGVRLDYEQALIPSASLGWMQRDAAYPFAASLVAEFPQGAERDSADVLVTAGQAFACGAARCALEFAGEDLEGFFQADEAEGGARLVLGPSLGWRLGGGREFTLFGGWVHAATQNAPLRPGFAENRDGVMLRAGVRLGG